MEKIVGEEGRSLMRRIAYHEAGHAAMARRQHFMVDELSIDEGCRFWVSLSMVWWGFPVGGARTDRRGRTGEEYIFDSWRCLHRNEALVFAAGPLAEALSGAPLVGDVHGDFERVHAWAGVFPDRGKSEARQVRDLVNRAERIIFSPRWTRAISALAEALLIHPRLGEAEVDRIIRRALRNAPAADHVDVAAVA